MKNSLKSKKKLRLLFFLLCFLPCIHGFLSAEENFLLINGRSNEKILELGSDIDERITPCSTFKITLSLMGFDAGILVNENLPVWPFQEGYDDFLPAWKNAQTPESWMKTSCIWYSKILASNLGLAKFQEYLKVLEYGNQDISEGFGCPWQGSSLKISLKEQVVFIRKMLEGELPVSSYSVQITKNLLFIDEWHDGWRLFGKTGWSGSTNKPDGQNEIAWFIGWIEKGDLFFPFAYNIRKEKIDLTQRIPRTKQLLFEGLKKLSQNQASKSD